MSKTLKNKYPLISIIIPTRNEESDIKKTLKACIEVDYDHKEIVVVDDSTDNTPSVVREFESNGVRLIHREVNKGKRCGARNRGIEESRGEIIIILNADVILPSDFIRRVLLHYHNGADFVLVGSEVINRDRAIPRFIDSLEKMNHEGNLDWVYWTEGFSCLRQVAIDVGMFPVPEIPLTAGEDGFFGGKLLKAGFKKTMDQSIVIGHYAPSTIKELWINHRTRVSSLTSYFLEGKSILEILIRTIGRSVVFFLSLITVLPYLIKGYRVSMRSEKKLRDMIPFIFIHMLQDSIFLFGKWQSFFQLLRWRLGYE